MKQLRAFFSFALSVVEYLLRALKLILRYFPTTKRGYSVLSENEKEQKSARELRRSNVFILHFGVSHVWNIIQRKKLDIFIHPFHPQRTTFSSRFSYFFLPLTTLTFNFLRQLSLFIISFVGHLTLQIVWPRNVTGILFPCM